MICYPFSGPFKVRNSLMILPHLGWLESRGTVGAAAQEETQR